MWTSCGNLSPLRSTGFESSEARTGYIDRGAKAEGELCATHDEEPAVIRIVRDSTGLG